MTITNLKILLMNLKNIFLLLVLFLAILMINLLMSNQLSAQNSSINTQKVAPTYIYSESERIYSELNPVYSETDPVFSESEPIYSEAMMEVSLEISNEVSKYTLNNNEVSKYTLSNYKSIKPKVFSLEKESDKKKYISSTKNYNIPQGQNKQNISIKNIHKQDVNSKKSESSEKEVILFINEWAQKWSEMDVNAYLSCYSRNFIPPNNLSRKDWISLRKKRLSKEFISVRIVDPTVKFHSDILATIKFKQIYKSNNYNSTDNKSIEIEKHNKKWYIIREKY